MSEPNDDAIIRKLLCWTAPSIAFSSAAALGFYLSSGSFLNAGLASLILLCSLALTIKNLPSPSAERQLWVECLFWLHVTLSLGLSFCSGYWFTETAFWNNNHFYFWYALVAGILALGVSYRKQWVPIAFLLFYISLIAIPLGLIVYLLLFTGSMYKLFHAAIVFVLLALPTLLTGRWILGTLFRKGRSRHFAPNGMTHFGLESLLMWSTILILLLPGNLNYIRWVLEFKS